MQDVANHVGGLGKVHKLRFDLPIDATVYAYGVCKNFTRHNSTIANQKNFGADIARHFAINLDLSAAFKVAYDVQVGTDNRRRLGQRDDRV